MTRRRQPVFALDLYILALTALSPKAFRNAH